jgi:predicted RNA-binding protein with PIN domain
MSNTYLIDGYNLLHALGLVRKRVAKGELDQARRRLVARLQEGFAKLHGTVTVVFDAKRKPRRAPAEEMMGDIRVLFAVQREADDLLEELIGQHPQPRRLYVVSDDHRVERAAQRRGAIALGCQAFLDLLERPQTDPSRQSPSPAAQPAQPMSAEEKLHWLREFGDVEIPDELRDAFDDGQPDSESP